ncbi:putative reticulocyte-binding protein 2 like protein a [Amylocarpus encephaloides]|uniref:Reticulocyte-binding protein 2 like protein a n=1 Tax=Amylocarpus encephaloides TaxID=45428 RepID=A0A9P7YKF6_9HELO|nr:putative reticulocyte-binding protein 2 like protein a [Amylocarpus encephaloides]
MSGPPPPPPHGENPKSSGLPPGKYDIFIIPPHSSGSGFLYLPSLQPNVNSFAAGFASALILVAIGSALAPAVQAWWNSVKGSGGMGMILLMVAIGVGAWVLGRTQTDGGPGAGRGPSGGTPGPESGPQPSAHSNPQNGYASGGPPPPPRSGPQAGPQPGGQRSGGWQRGGPPPGADHANGGGYTNTNGAEGAAKGAWERAREETKRKEEERKAREAAQKRKEELEKKLREAREKEAREREARERRQKEEEARAKAKLEEDIEKELEKDREREREKQRLRNEAERVRLRQKQDREKEEEISRQREKEKAEELEGEKAKALQREKDKEKAKLWEKRKEETKRLQAEREKARQSEKEKAERAGVTIPRGSSYAFSAVGEKTNPWPKGRPPSPPAVRKQPASPTKQSPAPAARTSRETEGDAYSYRPYDQPRRPPHKNAPSSVYSQSSYAESQSTSRTTPPPSHRGPYTTQDPNKIVIKAVYAFNNTFQKIPTSQLVSGVGSVTDGLILRITTEGLFIDDDVRGVPQREWDVKAWTMKLVEVWCPSFRQGPAGNSASAASSHKNLNPVRRLWGMDKDKVATSEETDALLVDMLQLCNGNCRARSTSYASSAYSASSAASDDRSSITDSAYGSSAGESRTNEHGVSYQTGELKSARLHVLRASIRDQEGKKYVFVIDDTESWKVAVGLQKLRKGTQVRALGVSGMSTADARGTLDHLGWT